MANHIINFKNIKIDYDCLISGKENLIESLAKLNSYKRYIYPQGFEFCVNILKEQIEKNGTVLMCSSKSGKSTIFYFHLTFDKGYKIYYNSCCWFYFKA